MVAFQRNNENLLKHGLHYILMKFLQIGNSSKWDNQLPKLIHSDNGAIKLQKIISVTYLDGYRLLLAFKNGEKRIYDREKFGFDGVWEYIKDINNFKKVTLVFGALTWYRDLTLPEDECNELDICPDFAYTVSEPLIKS